MDQEEMDRAWEEIIQAQNEEYRITKESDEWVMSQAKDLLEPGEYEQLEQIVTCVDGFTGGLSIVDEPVGELQEGDFGNDEWVDQHCGALEYNYYGNIYIKLTEGKYLCIPYSC